MVNALGDSIIVDSLSSRGGYGSKENMACLVYWELTNHVDFGDFLKKGLFFPLSRQEWEGTIGFYDAL